MNRITRDVPRWHIYLHRRDRKLERVTDTDAAAACFHDEVFAQLYRPDTPVEPYAPTRFTPEEMGWLAGAMDVTTKLVTPEVRAACKDNLAQSALATQWIIEILDGVVHEIQQTNAAEGQKQDAATGLDQVAFEGDPQGHEQYKPDDKDRLAAVGKLIHDDERLKRIALLAGRFKRSMLTKQKAKVRHDPDEISDIEQGGELARLLPSELVKLLSPQLQRAFKADLLEKKCLQYAVKPIEYSERGPFVLCMDKSLSMEGDKDVWATAVGLALLDMAHRQKRTFILLGFDEDVFQAIAVFVGKSIPKEHLCVAPRGGTNIANVLHLGLHMIETRKAMRRADIILITDGESDTSLAASIRARAKKNDVSILGVGIGLNPESLAVWCDESRAVTDMHSLDDKTAALLFST